LLAEQTLKVPNPRTSTPSPRTRASPMESKTRFKTAYARPRVSFILMAVGIAWRFVGGEGEPCRSRPGRRRRASPTSHLPRMIKQRVESDAGRLNQPARGAPLKQRQHVGRRVGGLGARAGENLLRASDAPTPPATRIYRGVVHVNRARRRVTRAVEERPFSWYPHQ
jgi:hypothetical protein